jgi:CRISPR type III-B/RAMP module RAMP protein Cmr1
MITPVLPSVETITIIATSKWSIKNNAKQEELREEAFVYMYRYWIRALLGDYKTAKRIENEIFGSTDFGSKVKIQVVNDTRGERRDVFAIGDKVTIRCVYATEADKESVHPLLEAITKVVAFLGGVGGKTARGFGCFRMQTSEETNSNIEEINNSLQRVYYILKGDFKVDTLPIIDSTNTTITLSGQTDVNEKYPFLRKVKALPLNRKKSIMALPK